MGTRRRKKAGGQPKVPKSPQEEEEDVVEEEEEEQKFGDEDDQEEEEEDNDDDEKEEEDDDDDDEDGDGLEDHHGTDEQGEEGGSSDGGDDNEDSGDYDEEEDEKAVADRLKKEAKKFRDEIERRGVVYLSSVPLYMKPVKVKHLLGQYGEVTRLYLVEEDASARKRRIKAGGKRKKKYVEGWVEFADKSLAKRVAQHLNGNIVGGKKRNFHHDVIWNIKYLKGFKWRHLTEKLAYERRVREQKLRVEMMQAKKENAHFAQLVEKKKEIEGIEARKRKRAEQEEVEGQASGGQRTKPPSKVIRRFHQVAPMAAGGAGDGKVAVDTSLLKSVFKKKP